MVETLKTLTSDNSGAESAWSAPAQTSSLTTPAQTAWGHGPVTHALEAYARQSHNAMAMNSVDDVRNRLSTTPPGAGDTPLFSTPK
jgi:hypothetical protein